MKITKSQNKWISSITALAIFVVLFIFYRDDVLNLLAQLNLQSLKENYSELQIYFEDHPIQSILIYVSIYTLATALSIPGAIVLTIAGGAIFGLLWGTVLVSFSSTIGATVAFLITRYFFRNSVTVSYTHLRAHET